MPIVIKPSKDSFELKVEQAVLDKGWTIKEQNDRILRYAGKYTCGDRSFDGRIMLIRRKNREPEIKALIFDPPAKLKKHPKGGCFSKVGKLDSKWFSPHWDSPPYSAISAIEYMEQLFTEVVNLE